MFDIKKELRKQKVDTEQQLKSIEKQREHTLNTIKHLRDSLKEI